MDKIIEQVLWHNIKKNNLPSPSSRWKSYDPLLLPIFSFSGIIILSFDELLIIWKTHLHSPCTSHIQPISLAYAIKPPLNMDASAPQSYCGWFVAVCKLEVAARVINRREERTTAPCHIREGKWWRPAASHTFLITMWSKQPSAHTQAKPHFFYTFICVPLLCGELIKKKRRVKLFFLTYFWSPAFSLFIQVDVLCSEVTSLKGQCFRGCKVYSDWAQS